MVYVPIERISRALAAVALIALAPSISNAQAKPAQTPAPRAAAALEVIQLRDNFYAIVGAGATIAVQVGPDGVILVDSGSGARSADVLTEIRKITNRPIRYIINTSAQREHVGGNDDLSKAGQSVIPTGGLNDIGAAGGRAPIMAEEHVQAAMTAPTGEQAPFPVGAWPTVTYSSDLMETQKDLYFNGEAIITTYQPNAYSDGDSVVFFRRSDVLIAGEVYNPSRFPRIDLEKGGSIQGVIDALNRIIGITVPPIPLIWQEGGTVVIGAHGTIGHEADVVDYRDMVTIIRDRIQDLMKKGQTLAQIRQADPVKGYRRRYGADTGPWTTNQFIEAVFKSLGGK
ncbi:MAG TPA: MBL fold metallo-hydrolase [Vicinamibacterales bacterium]|jgi:glyoxylase-like metal-dependent hydrolase (beta-lactamase superfamily II)|nr:MBL fold metallo-hydrolase [Vicinamibacterales bacterium]